MATFSLRQRESLLRLRDISGKHLTSVRINLCLIKLSQWETNLCAIKLSQWQPRKPRVNNHKIV